MEHSFKILIGKSINKTSWDQFFQNLKNLEVATNRFLAQARNVRDFDVNLQNQPVWKEAEGDFSNPVIGVRAVEKLTPDLISCSPHIDITKNLELATGRKLKRAYNSYKERESRAINPRRYYKPFYLRLYTSNSDNSILVLIPSAMPEATEYALTDVILPNFPTGVSFSNSSLNIDAMAFLNAVFSMRRLDRINSAYIETFEEGNQTPTGGIQHTFGNDAGSYQRFERWYNEQRESSNRVDLISVRFTLSLEDVKGGSFVVDLRPSDKSPIGISVSQKSQDKTEAYTLVTDVIHRIVENST